MEEFRERMMGKPGEALSVLIRAHPLPCAFWLWGAVACAALFPSIFLLKTFILSENAY
jgi:hypothetical protein